MSLRMFRYYFRARDLFDQRPIFSLAILADDNPHWKPDRHEEGIWDTGVHFTYRMVKLMDYESRLEELESSSNPFARFVLAHLKTLQTKGNYETRLEWKLRIIKGLYDIGVSEEEIGQLYHDFDWLLTLPERLSVRYHQEMVRFEEERTMPHLSTAERIGRKEGRIEEAQEAILEILEVRFGEVTPNLAEKIALIASLPRLHKFRRSLLEGMTLADFEEAVRKVKV